MPGAEDRPAAGGGVGRRRWWSPPRLAAVAGVTAVLLVAAGWLAWRQLHQPPPVGIHKIRHVVIIFQENRSFDSYFGTYPGADGIPMQNGVPTVCVPDPATGQCVRPYHDRYDENRGGPHNASNSAADVDGGKMDGFIAQA